MKIRIASSIALAAAIALGASGCTLIAPQATLIPYAPSDGVDVTVDGVNVRNLMLIADETGENFNVVFSSVNLTDQEHDLTITFTGKGSETARAEFTIPTGNTRFGNPDGAEVPVLVSIPGLEAGQTVDAYFQTPKSSEKQQFIPVLNGEHKEYAAYVLPADFGKKKDDASEAAKKQAAEDAKASDTKINDDNSTESDSNE
ncbi:DNA modification methylase [Leucobacter viscericola]|uniref:DNA modification methylase n=1 Tax=Leucobacter viscericola TaxID=2714935 RepID=A0A6G7XHY1_9MICO|nr:DNA modification methylase [Leucobacter viscericola]QIK63987.1 DNA modification methylase [Leucobacter viscericola]